MPSVDVYAHNDSIGEQPHDIGAVRSRSALARLARIGQVADQVAGPGDRRRSSQALVRAGDGGVETEPSPVIKPSAR